MIAFPTSIAAIEERIQATRPKEYGYTRNYREGAVTYLSPYISRGVISTRTVWENLKTRAVPWHELEKLVQELAWRDYFQKVAIEKDVNEDIRQKQPEALNTGVPTSIIEAGTGINAIDHAIQQLYQTGYMHNHFRMYVASLACNLGKCHWKNPAQWMYYHLLDADWASNACSWQWVAGANSSKKYYANQENINKFDKTHQVATFLDTSTELLSTLSTPPALKDVRQWSASCPLPQYPLPRLKAHLPVILYTPYNLDPYWKKDIEANRVLLLDEAHFGSYPVSEKTLAFIVALAQNIPGIQIYAGRFEELKNASPGSEIYFKEHPFFNHYNGHREERDWLAPSVKGYFPSFFAYWKRVEKIIKEEYAG